jgi:S1-C subfamily serine protease
LPLPSARRTLLAALLAAVLPGGCARLPGGDAAGTPAAAVSQASFAAVASAGGAPLGSAVAIAGQLLVTNRHVVRGADAVLLRRGDGQGEAPGRVIARSERMDLAVIAAPPGFLAPARPARALPSAGQPVWAAGVPNAGPAVAAGRVARPAVLMTGFGEGFTAQVGALLGYSGGPVVDAAGELLGLTTALHEPGAATLLAVLSGLDLDGLARADRREVFVLGLPEIRAELARLLPPGGLP